MKRTVAGMTLAAALSGCVTTEQGGGAYMSHAFDNPDQNANGIHNGAYRAQAMPGFQSANGQPMAMTAAAAAPTPENAADAAARATLAKALPPELFQQVVAKQGQGLGQGVVQAGGVCPPGGCPTGGCPTGMPGMGMPGMGMPGMGMPGMGMPGPALPGSGIMGPPGAVAAVGALTGGAVPFKAQRTEVRFVSPAGMKVSWFVPGPDGKPAPSPQYLETPGRYNFIQAAIYRLKLSDIPNRPGVELYPTLEVVPSGARAQAFLAHSAVPITFTEEDFEQVASGNYVVKVIYLPDPQFQDLASTGPDEVVSSRLEPGQDPIAEAHRRGSILLVVRLGNIDLEAPNTPAMDAPSAYQRNMMAPGMAGPGMMGPGMMPPGMAGPGMMPPGMMPPGMMAGRMPPQPPVMPKGTMPPGMIPPGFVPPGFVPPGMKSGNVPPGMIPSGKAPPATGVPSVKVPAVGTPMVPMVPPQFPSGPTPPAVSANPLNPTSWDPANDGSIAPPSQTTATKPAASQGNGKKSLLDLFYRSN